MATSVLKTFENHRIRATKCRTDILNYFSKNNFAISFPQLEKALSKHDRTSVYRNLLYFEEQGLIHKLSDAEGIIKYALCNDSCSDHQHQDSHIHFTCTSCTNTFCLTNKEMPSIQVPKKYKLESYSIIAKGLCENCK